MRPELSEKLFVENLFINSSKKLGLGEVNILEVDKMTGDASTRRYYRVVVDGGISFVVCLDNPVSGVESNFIILQGVYQSHGIRVPEIIDKNLDMGYILEEDLGNETFIINLSKTSRKEEKELYQKAILELIKIHSIDVSKYSDLTFTKLSFNSKKLFDEMEFTIEHFLRGYLAVDLTSLQQRELNRTLQELCNDLDVKNKVLTHRDFHSRNIMIKNKELVLIDFQDSRMGIPQYDLVSLLEDCYFSLDYGNVVYMKELYWDNFLSKKGYQTKEEYLKLYDLMTVQRVLKAIGSFSYIYKLRGDKRYIKYIGFGFEKLRKVLNRLERYESLKQILSEVYYGN